MENETGLWPGMSCLAADAGPQDSCVGGFGPQCFHVLSHIKERQGLPEFQTRYLPGSDQPGLCGTAVVFHWNVQSCGRAASVNLVGWKYGFGWVMQDAPTWQTQLG